MHTTFFDLLASCSNFVLMIDFTPLAKKRFLSRLYDQLRYANYADAVQQGELVKLIERASLTEFGRKYHFSNMRTYREFASTVPLYRYEDLRPQIMRMVSGEANVLWRGKCFNFAQSSGTTDGKSKYIPITADSLKTNHYQGASDVVSHYLNLNPASRIFSGKGFILGGSFANQLQLKPGTRVGDLSATLIQNINPLVNLFRVPSKKVALMEDWTEKLPALVEASLNENITNLSGVPSWFLTVLKEVMARKGVSCIHEVWPNLEVFFHGGIAFAPYREQYEKICDMSKMHFLDTYNASEGFFAVQSSWETTAMLLLLDIGVFYEFIPIEDTDSPTPEVYPVWEVEAGKTYELVITACNGLWRYRIGDTVTIEQTNPVKIKIAGRTKNFINAFGEELIMDNAEKGLAYACEKTGAQVAEYTAAPVYMDSNAKCRHQWLIEFSKEPESLDEFASLLDRKLQEINSDYEAKRFHDVTLQHLEIVKARPGVFNDWLKSKGKLGGQHKIPRLSNSRKNLDEMLMMNK